MVSFNVFCWKSVDVVFSAIVLAWRTLFRIVLALSMVLRGSYTINI